MAVAGKFSYTRENRSGFSYPWVTFAMCTREEMKEVQWEAVLKRWLSGAGSTNQQDHYR